MKLEEVVVVGYGTRKKCDVTGAVSSVNCAAPVFFNPSTEEYNKVNETGFRQSKASPLSTFSIDVDKASYSNVKRFLNQGQKPPADAVRIEEMVNYFEYDYPQPTDGHPFSITTEYSDCPWQKGHKLLHIGLQGKKIATDKLPASNLVFLIDVSGSMNDPHKLPLLKSSFKLLVNNLRSKDRVAIVVYAGAAGIVLPSTSGDKKSTILDALDRLQAGGSTAGAEGIRLAYETAKDNFIDGGNNRIILATDGDFNVGVSGNNELEDLITAKRQTGIYLTCLGFGMGNYKDSKMETLADKGNGNYAYINDIQEANKVLVSEFGGTLFTIAKDVKIQVEFNPAKVKAYRLVGYENRMLNSEDFKDDTKDAGELGSGHTVTAIYELVPAVGKQTTESEVDELKYQVVEVKANSEEIATIKFRYKKPDEEESIEMVHPVAAASLKLSNTSDNYRFSVSVAMFGMLLRDSKYKGSGTINDVIELAENARGKDKDGYRSEFIRLVRTQLNDDLSEK
jgi:Ca-activated chloride channel family protein